MIQVYSQRDKKWKDLPLGSSTNTTIGSHGCTITCLGMLAGIPPDEVNRRLLNVDGYADKNLVIWAKVKEAIPWLEFEWRGYLYENDRVKKAIEENHGCLVEVDYDGKINTPNDKHWVLYVGNKRMVDPWTGTEKDTSYYPLTTGYAIIKVKGNVTSDYYKGIDLNNHESIKVCIDTWKEVVDGLYIKKEVLAKAQEEFKTEKEALNVRVKEEKKRYKEFVADLAQELNCTQEEPAILEEITRAIACEDKVTELERRLTAQGRVVKTHEETIEALRQELATLRKQKIDNYSGWQLIAKGLAKLLRRKK